MVHLAGIARLDHQRTARARAFAHEVMVHARRGEQARDRRVRRAHAAVGQDQNRVPGVHRIAGAGAQVEHRPLEPRPVLGGIEQHRQRDGPEPLVLQVSQLGRFLVADHRVRDLDLPARLGPRVQQVAFRADRRLHRGHQFLADGVERWIRHLREQLLEIVVQHARPVREHGQRRVGAHRPDGFLGVERHGREDQAQVLLRVPERLLAPKHGRVIRFREVRCVRQVGDVDQVLGEPFPVRAGRRQLPLDLVVRDDAAQARVDEKDLAGVQAPLQHDVLGRDVEHPDLRGHDDQVIGREAVSRGPQAVAIEHGADDRPVGEGNRRGAIPRLHEGRVILVERPPLRIERRIAAPRLGDHHENGVRQRAARHGQELEHVVERRRVGAALADDRKNLREILAKLRRLQQPLARAHPVDVAAQCVDLAVVGHQPVRVRERPRRKRVGAEPLVHECQRGVRVRVGQIREERCDLIGREHALVDQRARREADDVEEMLLGQREAIDLMLDALPRDVQLAFEAQPVRLRIGVEGEVLAAADEQVLEDRLRGDCTRAQEAIVGRYLAPAEQLQVLFLQDRDDERLDRAALRTVARQEDQSGAILPGLWQLNAERARHPAEKAVRHLNQDPGAVPGVGLAPAGAAVQQIDEQLQPLRDDGMGAPALHVDDEANAARVVLVPWIVEALRPRRLCACARHGRAPTSWCRG